ncbi:MAG: hypothetical protein EBT71_02580 [Alphaproteobacteria bacterium]|nr:hypothetical protein [Alphaproteobacteria bacterium]
MTDKPGVLKRLGALVEHKFFGRDVVDADLPADLLHSDLEVVALNYLNILAVLTDNGGHVLALAHQLNVRICQ